ncbi:hypothetical protein DPSP01_006885 [Paraphaeosphaeria sporulosa]|uniref:C2H2-type domain-containing protein n=1 Tax=Paraphaeosphaeria sporulosa TaxID=1460663 RepID=A0A177CNZ6_9PLEO|nr:uncharacterized protein CC84DRAFT_1203849 [Paraphaeosphaeria sporulosa]OAG08487.1 hypothetical protein CC84DRAFT_1203849 [Paraphaeosphaeria sporulosa]
MPPPRLTRPLRPWQPPSTSARARWLSHRPRDQSTPRRGDGALGGGEPGQPATEAKPEADAEAASSSHDAPAAGWLRGLAARVSTLVAKPSPSSLPPAPPNRSPPAPFEDQPRAPASSEHDAPPASASLELQSGTSCLVCHKTFENPKKLRYHIWNENHVESWPLAFQTREEAVDGAARATHWLRFQKELGPNGWEVARGMTQIRKEGKTCIACQTPLPTLEAHVQHWLFNEACRKDQRVSPSLFACWRCFKTFKSYAQAGEHVQSSPDCLGYIKARYAPKLLPKAEYIYRRSVAELLAASSALETFSSPRASSLAHGVHHSLRPLFSQAHEARDNDLLALFHKHPQAVNAIRKLASPEAQQQTKSNTSTRSLTGPRQATQRKPYSTEPRVLPTLEPRAHQRPLVAKSSSSSQASIPEPQSNSDARQKAGDPKSDKDTKLHDKPQGQDIAARKDAIPRSKAARGYKISLRNLRANSEPQGGGSTPVTSKSDSSSTKVVNAAPEYGPPLSGKDKPAISFANPDANNAELRLQIDYLAEQVRFLNEKIAGQATSDAKVPSVKPTVASAIDPRTTQDLDGTSRSSTDFTELSLPTMEQSTNHAPVRRYGLKSQAQLSNEKIRKVLSDNDSTQLTVSATASHPLPDVDIATKASTDRRRLVRETPTQAQMQTQARMLRSLDSPNPSKMNARPTPSVDSQTAQTSPAPPPTQTPLATGEMSEQSLLAELFPEASNYIQPHYDKRNPYPKLDLPSSKPIVWKYAPTVKPKSSREKYLKAFQRSTEKLTALQLLHCSTELTEVDFRRLVPQGQHIEGWAPDGDIHQIIPGRDPLSLERLPFYYLIFKNPEAALRYQSNASRLDRLSKLHGPTSSLSVIPPPPGLLENGEDLSAALSSYLLTPQDQPLRLNMVVQPYNPALARLIADGGYAPIVPSTTSAGKPIHKVLFYIEGYEPSPYDLYQIFMQDALSRGLTWPFLHDHQSIHRLRDIVDLKARFTALSTASPRASSSTKRKLAEVKSHDPYTTFLSPNDSGEGDDAEGQDAQAMNQVIMNRVYNRWVVEFSEEAGARRFARLWHRKVLPMQGSVRNRTWRDVEEVRLCNAEYLW